MTDAVFDALPRLLVMEELDEMYTLEELRKAIDNLACKKVPGKNSIPPEVLRQASLPSSSRFTSSSANAGLKDTSHKT